MLLYVILWRTEEVLVSVHCSDTRQINNHKCALYVVWGYLFCHVLPPPSLVPDPHPLKITCTYARPPLRSVAFSYFYASANLSLLLLSEQLAMTDFRRGAPQLSDLGAPSSDPRKRGHTNRVMAQLPQTFCPGHIRICILADVKISLPVIPRGRQARPLAPEVQYPWIILSFLTDLS